MKDGKFGLQLENEVILERGKSLYNQSFKGRPKDCCKGSFTYRDSERDIYMLYSRGIVFNVPMDAQMW